MMLVSRAFLFESVAVQLLALGSQIPSMVRTILLLTWLPVVGTAQQPASRGTSVPNPAGILRAQPSSSDQSATRITSTIYRRLPTPAAPDTTRTSKLARYTFTGLGVGAALGVVGGAIGSRYAGCSCSKAAKIAGFSLWFGAIGAGAGAVVGAAVGAMHDRWP
jgi:hypothetical protein